MGDLPGVLTSITAMLLAISLAILALRIAKCRRRGEPSWLAALLACLLLRLFMHDPPPAGMVLSLAAIWAAGCLLARIAGRPRGMAWHLGCLVAVLAIAAASSVGYGRSMPLRALHHFSALLLACAAAPALSRLWRRPYPAALTAAAVSALLWGCAAISETVLLAALKAGQAGIGSRIAATAAIGAQCLLAASIGMLVLLDGYPWTAGLHGRAADEAARERLLHSAYARLLETENALALQDALIASGLLALGAAHEFKRSLCLLSAAAEHGLAADTAAGKDASLRLVMEQARSGTGAAVAFLERLSCKGREAERVVDARDDLQDLLRVSRASARPEGIVIRADLAPGVRFRARPSEVGQIMLNLLDNAVRSLRRGAGDGERRIEVSASAAGGRALIEVRDTGGGVQPHAAARLFTVGSSSSGSTGIGLYICRSLAERNGGAVSYLPLEGGSCFRVAFPLVEESDACGTGEKPPLA